MNGETTGQATGNGASSLVDWLLDQGLRGRTLEELLPPLVEKLTADGMAIARFHLSGTILHPDYGAFSRTWYRDQDFVSEEFPHDSSDEVWRRSPLYYAVSHKLDMMHCDLRDPAEQARFPVFGELAAQGMTDYIALTVGFGETPDGETGTSETGSGVVVSMATDDPDGFSDHDVKTLRALWRPLGLVAKVAIFKRVSQTILTTYLGRDPGLRVLEGQIRRGMAQTINAAILFADLRGFTSLADVMPRDRLVLMLDDYLDAMAAPVDEVGGQVLKFMGDGMLATFALDGADPSAVCRAALEAAMEAQARVAKLNAARADGAGMALDVALHVGEVMYGNVGSRSRLDFTVIGPAVNEASRMENLCTPLDCGVVISRPFIDAVGDAGRFRCLGPQTLRGLATPRELFTLA